MDRSKDIDSAPNGLKGWEPALIACAESSLAEPRVLVEIDLGARLLTASGQRGTALIMTQPGDILLVKKRGAEGSERTVFCTGASLEPGEVVGILSSRTAGPGRYEIAPATLQSRILAGAAQTHES